MKQFTNYRNFSKLVLCSICILAINSISDAFAPTHKAYQLQSHVPKVFNEKSIPNKSKIPSYLSASDEESTNRQSDLPMLLDPGTKGGALFLSLVLFVVPIVGYEVVTLGFGIDGVEAGRWIGVGFTLLTCVLWVSTYIFRVATKDMTYAKQLKDYENAVIAKRLEELDEDEIQALVEDIERDDF
mmetsp:Transcript_78/g.103  ORF Transcript_78/g.103 Transcript_78/m.103 type:complete len:185 (+) Transcript_78:57-611(+)